ncbi:MAG: ATP-binding cassette domain-containing protein [Myxococcota bacterium]
MSAGLEARFIEEVGADGVDTDSVSYAANFTRLVVRSLGLVNPSQACREILVRAICSIHGWGEGLGSELLALALLPEFRDGLRDEEMWAFSNRFGTEAAAALKARDASMDLRGFAERYGPRASLQMLDTLFAVATADTVLNLREVHRLEEAALELDVDAILVTALLQKHDHRMADGELRFPLVGDRLVIGRSIGTDILLADPQVAQRHAELSYVGDGWRVSDLGSGRPTVLNGRSVASAPLNDGDSIQVGPYVFRRSGEELIATGERQFTSLSVRGLQRHIGDTPLIDDVSFTVFSGEVIAVVGPSGCGKTTLLNAINGVAPADTGDVLLDGQSFHTQLQSDRSLVGIVPQDDLVHAELTVEESLFYSGQLRVGSDVSDQQIREQVDRVLEELELEHIRHNRIGDVLRRGISGGQRKRVNLGQELMSRSTRVLFLDEPTSGLDPRASQDIARRVRQLADRGRIVFLVTHDLTPEIIAQVDHMLVLAPGGRLAFFGPPADACRWFDVLTPDAVFNRFGDHSPETWADNYKRSESARKYVDTREHLVSLGGITPKKAPEAVPSQPSFWTQVWSQLSRYSKVKFRDRTGVVVLAAQPPLLALVMWLVFPEPTTALMFMLALSCLWFGMSASVRELITDRVIWRRERRVGLGVLPYLLSKVAVLGMLVTVQCLVFTGLLFYVLNMVDYGFDFMLLGLVTTLTGLVGMSLGLLVSASWTSSEAAVGTLPLLLIPQITFSSIMVSVRSMGELAQLCSWFTVQRYSFDAVIKCGDELAYFKYGQWQRQRVRGFLYELGLKGSAKADDIGLSLEALGASLCGFIFLFLSVATLLTWNRGRNG